MSMLVTVPYYRIPRDSDDRPNRDFDRLFVLALRWHPEVAIPEEMVSSTSKKRKEEPQHAGLTALHSLRDGNAISQRQLRTAIDYLIQAIAWYESGPDEPFPGRNEEALTNLNDLLAEVQS